MTIEISMHGKKLILWGMILFFIGLLEGAAIPYFQNPRMALSAHLAAVQSGMALVIFGIVWAMLNLRDTWSKLACYSAISGMYVVWIAITLGAILGASKALPIAGSGYSATPTGEAVVQIIVTAGAGLVLLSTGLIVFALSKSFR